MTPAMREYVQAGLAFMITAILAALITFGIEVPDYLPNAWLVVISFFYGASSARNGSKGH